MMQPWLETRRTEAGRLNAQLPIPTGGEDWRRTNFARANLDQFKPLLAAQNGAGVGEASRLLPEPLALAGEILYGDKTSPATLDKNLAQKGVLLTPLAQACEKNAALVERYLGRGFQNRQEKFLVQNEAGWQTGVFLYIPPHTQVDLPILLASRFTQEGTGLFPRLLIVLDKGSKATGLHLTASQSQTNPNYINAVSEIYLEEGADLNWVEIADLADQTYQIGLKRSEVGSNANLQWILYQRGGKISKTNIETVLNGEGAQAKVSGLIQGKNRQHLELASLTHHQRPHTTANILIKATADDRAKTIFQGMIKIDKTAQQTESYMANHNLILNDKAHCDSIPRLEIEADDVKASHGASIGQVDAEQMFYLRSKGLPAKQAETLLVEGFYEEIFGRISNESVHQLLQAYFEKPGG